MRRSNFGSSGAFLIVMDLALAHRAAALGAFATGFDAILHIADGLARIGAGVTNFGALGANMRMMIRLAQHEISAGDADLCAIHHQFNRQIELRGIAKCGDSLQLGAGEIPQTEM